MTPTGREAMTIDPAALARLSEWDTPTICNALEAIDPAWRLHGYTTRAFTCLRPEAKPIVGYARTATIRASVKASVPNEAAQAMRMRYYEYVAAGPTPSVVVIQDLDTRPGTGAFWGEVNTAIHKGLGALGVVTNGSIRDLEASAPGFQALAGQVGPSHAWVHVTGFGEQVEVHGMSVRDGDIVHADCHGAVVVPSDAVARLPDAIGLIARREAVILKAARAPDFDIEKLRAAMQGAAEIH
jgi:regulator of RNase E activity RraA